MGVLRRAPKVGSARQTRTRGSGHRPASQTTCKRSDAVTVADFDSAVEKSASDARAARGRILRNRAFYESPLTHETAMTQEDRDGGIEEDVRESIESTIEQDGDDWRREYSAR